MNKEKLKELKNKYEAAYDDALCSAYIYWDDSDYGACDAATPAAPALGAAYTKAKKEYEKALKEFEEQDNE